MTFQPAVRSDEPVHRMSAVIRLDEFEQTPNQGLGYAAGELKGREVVVPTMAKRKNTFAPPPAPYDIRANRLPKATRHPCGDERWIHAEDLFARVPFARLEPVVDCLELGIHSAEV